MDKWKIYNEKLKGSKPRPILVEAASLCAEKGRALDIGAGAMNEAKYLASLGFSVVALEPSADSFGWSDDVDVQCIKAELYQYPPEDFDLVAALYAIPFFDNPEKVLRGIERTLKAEGIFVGQFFGPNDDWKDHTTVHEAQKIQDIFQHFDLVKFDHFEGVQPTALQGNKYWDVYDIIARKR
jgi:tellurite methyltransferase